ncbi:bifunctional folylpolyglutamate synthase/dihydrofolate synthase [Candidatus Magnetaquicoccus inordinatus]|uniref:bifunctional folylpolyglutamate synthase/dihydrofolate synthase n=1 Tax=Candidatus Magnetaquicoccus inordinatus TaxID=2496818 RepID=UPI00102CAE8F|nr:folylpolyglutamate synthase/dihydrofolate synthase family protein [Candidatus Magnetaquicoccus inordinatus]
MSSLLAELLQRISRQTPLAVQLGLQRVDYLLDALGNPQHAVPTLHVAGTNGKGSVLAFLESVLLQAGWNVGLYTSPHLQQINERYRWLGQPVEDATLVRHLNALWERFPHYQATFFEWLTVLAFVLFREWAESSAQAPRPTLLLLETGLGGRLDATNVVTPELTLITSIDWDHTDYLGGTLAAIAREKAGIFKKGVAAFASRQPEEVVAVLRQEAQQLAVPLALQGEDFDHDGKFAAAESWQFWDREGALVLPRPALAGKHQYDNAALAVAALRYLQQQQWPVPEQAIVQGVANARWPARLESFYLADYPGISLLLDGAHNPSGCQVLAAYLTSQQVGRCTFLFAALRDKEVAQMVAQLQPFAERVYTVAVGGERALSAQELAFFWQGQDCLPVACTDVREAMRLALAVTPVPGVIVVCGSLYLAGQVRALLQESRQGNGLHLAHI